MDDPPIHLGPREQRRARLLNEHLAGRLTVAQVAGLLGVSERQVFRLLARYRRAGPAALVHGDRGRRPWHALPEDLAERVVELVRTRYEDANHSHLAELLAEREGIHTLSPQAKGRIERLWGTLQGRLVTELALEGITDIAAANAFLPGFLERFDERLGVPAWRPLTAGVDLARICCCKYARVVAADGTISFAGRSIQLLPADRRSLTRARVEVQEHLDGSLLVLAHGDPVATVAAPPDPVDLHARQACQQATSGAAGSVGPPEGSPVAKVILTFSQPRWGDII